MTEEIGVGEPTEESATGEKPKGLFSKAMSEARLGQPILNIFGILSFLLGGAFGTYQYFENKSSSSALSSLQNRFLSLQEQLVNSQNALQSQLAYQGKQMRFTLETQDLANVTASEFNRVRMNEHSDAEFANVVNLAYFDLQNRNGITWGTVALVVKMLRLRSDLVSQSFEQSEIDDIGLEGGVIYFLYSNPDLLFPNEVLSRKDQGPPKFPNQEPSDAGPESNQKPKSAT